MVLPWWPWCGNQRSRHTSDHTAIENGKHGPPHFLLRYYTSGNMCTHTHTHIHMHIHIGFTTKNTILLLSEQNYMYMYMYTCSTLEPYILYMCIGYTTTLKYTETFTLPYTLVHPHISQHTHIHTHTCACIHPHTCVFEPINRHSCCVSTWAWTDFKWKHEYTATYMYPASTKNIYHIHKY